MKYAVIAILSAIAGGFVAMYAFAYYMFKNWP